MTTHVPGNVSLPAFQELWRGGRLNINQSAQPRVAQAAQIVHQAASGDAPVYGVNTGFGKLANVKIAPGDTATLQRNLILSHCAGVGEHLEFNTVGLMMKMKALSLARGASGVRWELIELLCAAANRSVMPCVPVQGSVGASGDLAPLAHMSAVLIGEGTAVGRDGVVVPGAEALAQVNLAPIELGPKEGLALINGTQFSTACGIHALVRAHRALGNAIITGALSTDAVMGSTAPLDAEIHSLRGHPGQMLVAEVMRDLLAGSEIRESHRKGDSRVQDPYCIRCQPQVTGAALDLLEQAGRTLEIEANAVTDNPLVLVDEGRIVSGGNFHGEPVAFAADQIALAMSEIGAIAQRRIALMVDPALSHDLPPFLTPEPGLNSGFMIAEVTSAALMSENKHLANPCSTDSTPTSANQEDHVSMSAHGARRLARMADNLDRILAIELLCAAQGIGFRKPLRTSPQLTGVIEVLRAHVPALAHDRFMSTDIETADRILGEGLIVECVDRPLKLTGGFG